MNCPYQKGECMYPRECPDCGGEEEWLMSMSYADYAIVIAGLKNVAKL